MTSKSTSPQESGDSSSTTPSTSTSLPPDSLPFTGYSVPPFIPYQISPLYFLELLARGDGMPPYNAYGAPQLIAMMPKKEGPPPQPGQPFKFTVAESCDRIKEEFSFLQAQYHNLKLECEKLASEKTEMQRHYVMYYEMSYGLNVEMHKQTEIAKRLNAIIAQIIPFLSQDHQQQVASAVERAKQVTMTELNAIIGQQMHAQQLPPHAHAPPLPMMPHAAAAMAGLQPPTLPPSSAAGLLALSSSLAAAGPGAHLSAAAVSSVGALKDHRDEKRSSSAHSSEDRHEMASALLNIRAKALLAAEE